jgi:hypothetical protein
MAAKKPKRGDGKYHGKINPEMVRAKQDAFLAAYGECGSLRAACEASGVGRSTVGDWVTKDAQNFKEKYETAKEMFREYLQDLAVSRIKDQKPTDNPVLLITMLNAHWPEKYRRDSQGASSGMKEIMSEWKRWVKENNRPSKKSPSMTEAEEAKINAVNEVEKILSKKRDPNDEDK